MQNFTYANPVKIIFGKGSIHKIKEEIAKDQTVLILYGGGSIKKNGVYSQVMSALEGYKVFELSGIEPNPHYETCMKAVELIKKEKIDFLLSVGGGSVLDATKFIAAATLYDGESWKILSEAALVHRALPFGSVITLPATGSEMNNGGVITKAATQEKLAFSTAYTFPLFSVLDPETTYSLPKGQIANGVVDTFVHVMEQYLTTGDDNALLQDCMAEAVAKTIVMQGPQALLHPSDYNIRANVMWASTWALNGWINCGVEQDWATHLIGHELTALFGLDHGQTLAIVYPGLMEVMKDQKAKKIIRMGKEIFEINEEEDAKQITCTIKAVEHFFEKVGIKTRLSDYNLGDEDIDKVVTRLKERGWKLGEKRNITPDVVRQILELRK